MRNRNDKKNGLALARAHNEQYRDHFVLSDGAGFLRKSTCDVVILMEVLEHIRNDTEVFEAMSPGTLCCCSVPDAWDFNHYRKFDNREAVEARYGAYVEILHYEEYVFPTGSKHLIFLGRKK